MCVCACVCVCARVCVCVREATEPSDHWQSPLLVLPVRGDCLFVLLQRGSVREENNRISFSHLFCVRSSSLVCSKTNPCLSTACASKHFALVIGICTKLIYMQAWFIRSLCSAISTGRLTTLGITGKAFPFVHAFISVRLAGRVLKAFACVLLSHLSGWNHNRHSHARPEKTPWRMLGQRGIC